MSSPTKTPLLSDQAYVPVFLTPYLTLSFQEIFFFFNLIISEYSGGNLQKSQTACSWLTEGVWANRLPITLKSFKITHKIQIFQPVLEIVPTWQMFQALTHFPWQIQVFLRHLWISQTLISISYGYVTFHMFVLSLIEYRPSKNWIVSVFRFHAYYGEQKKRCDVFTE